MIHQHPLLILIVTLLTVSTKAQNTRTEFIDVIDVIEKFGEYSEQEDYVKALDVLEQVAPYDTIYETLALKKILLHHELEQYDQALELCEWGLKHQGEYWHLFFRNKAATLNKLQKWDESAAVCRKGLEQFPENSGLKLVLASSFTGKEDYAAAQRIYQELIINNPYLPSPHYELGRLALRENATARMMMCMHTYLIVQTNENSKAWVLNLLDHLASSKKDSIPTGLFDDTEESFETITLLLDNYVALGKDYKTGSSIGLPSVKQAHLLFSQLAEGTSEGTGFWHDTYVPLFKELMRKNQFENYVYYIVSTVENEKLRKTANKKKGNIERYENWVLNYVRTEWNNKPIKSEPNLSNSRVFYSNNNLKSQGPVNLSQEVAEGEWTYFSTDGRLTAIGNLKDSKRHGEWVWYHPNGEVESKGNFKDGELDGQLFSFYPNGNPKLEAAYANGKREGVEKEYYINGALHSTKQYVDGQGSGDNLSFYWDGTISDSLYLVEGQISGAYRQYHNNGQLATLGQAKEDSKHGVIKEFYNNGQLRSEYTYDQGKLIDTGKEYHRNGQLAFEGIYEDGNPSGTQISYFQDGKKRLERPYNAAGEVSGEEIHYDPHGIPFESYTFSKGNITAYRFVDKDGNTLSQAKKKGPNFLYEGLYYDGTKQSTGLYNVKGGKEGSWEFFNEDGVLSSQSNYKENQPHGKLTRYFPNGKIKNTLEYADGLAEGEFIAYFGSGQVEEKGRYAKNELIGEWFTFNEMGQLIKISYYVNGQLIYRMNIKSNGLPAKESRYEDGMLSSIRYFDVKGKEIDVLKFEGGDGPLSYTFADGSPQVEGQMKRGERHGPFVFYEGSGTITSKGEFHYGNPHGLWNYYHENGQPRETVTYFYGEQEGKVQRWDWFGNLQSEGTYVNGKRHGLWTDYYPNGNKEATFEYERGDVNGKREFFAPSGELQMIRYYDHDLLISYSYTGKDGNLVDPIIIDRNNDNLVAYFQNGQVARQYSFVDGMFQGELIEYYPTGQIAYKANYLDDSAEGMAVEYYANGQVKEERMKKFGRSHGTHTVYWENGKKRSEVNYVLGEKHGPCVEWDENGNKQIEYTFYYDLLTNATKFQLP